MALLCKGTKVLVDPDGSFRRVEDLQVGDSIFDPLAQCMRSVSNIVPWIAGQDERSAPVLIPKHALNSSQPNEDFFAPQSLQIFVARVPKGQTMPVAKRVLVRDLIEDGTARIAGQLSGMHCFLLLTDEPALIMTNGVLSVGKSVAQQKSA